MTIEIHASGLACNLACDYCYQADMRRMVHNKRPDLDMAAVKQALRDEGGAFSVFGGEALLTPFDQLEELFAFGHTTWGQNSIQTNGTLMTDAHIDLFKRYNVSVGVSIDGPPELNRARRTAGVDATDRASRRSEDAIHALLKAGIPTSIIIVLHRLNAHPSRRPRLIEWLRGLVASGLRNVDLHLVEIENDEARRRLALSDRENIEALRDLKQIESLGVGVRLFRDLRRTLLADPDDQPCCIWNGCDPAYTRAVHGVDPDGSRVNCGRTNKDGVNWLKAEDYSTLRARLLHQTPQEHGGCMDCRFFFACVGNCPGTAIDGDWRNRSEHCQVWYALLEDAEAELVREGKLPASMNEERRVALEAQATCRTATNYRHGDSHGDAHADSDDPKHLYTLVAPIGRPR